MFGGGGFTIGVGVPGGVGPWTSDTCTGVIDGPGRLAAVAHFSESGFKQPEG